MTWNYESFIESRNDRLKKQISDVQLAVTAQTFLRESYVSDYCYQWDWAGFPILQMPEDIQTYQEIIFKTKPSVIIETGVAWGGGIALLASIMSLYNPQGQVLGIDLNLDPDLQGRLSDLNLPVDIELYLGSSTSESSLEWVKNHITDTDTVMVVLDSHHTHQHVSEELQMYSKLVSPGHFLVVGDTSVKDLADATTRVRPWTSIDNPHTALEAFLKSTDLFFRDRSVNEKLLTTFHPGGYLRRRQ